MRHLAIFTAALVVASPAWADYWKGPPGATHDDFVKMRYACLKETPYIWSEGETMKDPQVLKACYEARGWRYQKEG